MYRARTTPSQHCLTAHFVTGLALSTRQSQQNTVWPIHQTARLVETRKEEDITSHRRPHFCGMITSTIFKASVYTTDALVRHALVELLGEYKQCNSTALTGHPVCNAPRFSGPSYLRGAMCTTDFKFVVYGENQAEDGYWGEAFVNAVLSDAVPIYFGPPDLGRYVNLDRIVQCSVSNATLMHMRTFHDKALFRSYAHRLRKQQMAAARNESAASTQETKREAAQMIWLRNSFLKMLPEKDRTLVPREPSGYPIGQYKGLVEWAVKMLRRELAPCIKRVMALDQDDTQYRRMLARPLTNTHVLYGREPARGIADAVYKLT